MPTAKILTEKPISMAELKEELAKIKKKEELNFRAAKTEEYLQQFVNKNSLQLTEKLKKLNIPRLKDAHIIKIADTMPKNLDDLKIILQGYTLTVNNENMKKIVEIISKSSE